MIINFIKEWFHNGNETYLRLTINITRWYLPLGIDWRKHTMVMSGGIQRRYSVGFLCVQLIYTRYNGKSPYTLSLGEWEEEDITGGI